MKTKQKQKQKLISLGRVAVAGVQFSDYNLIKLRAGLSVAVVHERNNRFDRNALKLFAQGKAIGYIPKGEMQNDIHLRHNQGCKMHAKVVAYNPTNPTWAMITIEVWHTPIKPSYDYDKHFWAEQF